jgi:hypothetical protein
MIVIEPPTRTAQTWLFDGWPDAYAVEKGGENAR